MTAAVKKNLLPDGEEIARQRSLPESERPTFEEIGSRYGVSRQAAWKAWHKWTTRQSTRSV